MEPWHWHGWGSEIIILLGVCLCCVCVVCVVNMLCLISIASRHTQTQTDMTVVTRDTTFNDEDDLHLTRGLKRR